MKVNANAMAAFQRETPPGKAMNKPEKAERTPQNEVVKPSVVTPPGLQKVMAKMEALGESRTQGQNVAMGRIERNLAKYVETQQAVVTPLAPTITALESPSSLGIEEMTEDTQLADVNGVPPSIAEQTMSTDLIPNS